MASGSWLGVSQTAKFINSIHIGDRNQVARKAQAAWIGDANNKARLFYQSSVIVPSIESYFRNAADGGQSYDHEIVIAYKNGYCGYVFAPAKAYDNCKKATMYIYVTQRAGEELTIMLSNGSSDWLSASAGWADANELYFTPTQLGWNEIDITDKLNQLIASEGSVAEDGIKVYFRSTYGVQIAGKPRGKEGEFAAYLVLESGGASTPTPPTEPIEDVLLSENADSSVTLENVTFTTPSDGVVQMDNATFTVQNDGSVLVQ